MDDLSRLRTLLDHWREHNREHAETYSSWAERIAPADDALSQSLRKLSEETRNLDLLFEEARRRAGLASPRRSQAEGRH